MFLCFPQPDWSKWSFTLIWSEQLSAIWKFGIFTQCIKAEYTHLLLGALKMFLQRLCTLPVNVSLRACITVGFSSISSMA